MLELAGLVTKRLRLRPVEATETTRDWRELERIVKERWPER